MNNPYENEPNWRLLTADQQEMWLASSSSNDIENRIEDRKVNLEYCVKEEDNADRRARSPICDACMRALPPEGPTEHHKSEGRWYKCLVCNSYDECSICHRVKKDISRPHPHEMVLYHYHTGPAAHPEAKIPEDRILSFDGGGVRGYMTLLLFRDFASRLYAEQHRDEIPDDEARMKIRDKTLDEFVADSVIPSFNLICGTSIGGLLAIALSLGVRLSFLLETFENDSGAIFTRRWFGTKLNPPNYTPDGMMTTFRKVVRSIPMYENSTDEEIDSLTFANLKPGPDCAVTSFDMYTQEPMLFYKDMTGMKLIVLILFLRFYC
eukprot:TRINITY_DN2680_c0_g2_i2.p1 TRINITY_DN2680_c0_g2~~TRINITY_DN2680_c0_g2_i2.p1  ORF type:complete len:322 (+),score=44.57 TRINITY_DN2680_c0_g2_i2:106-1071(+)